jgi:hypothetical protein
MRLPATGGGPGASNIMIAFAIYLRDQVPARLRFTRVANI